MSFTIVPMSGAGASPYVEYQAPQPVPQQPVVVPTMPSQPTQPMMAQPLQPQCLVSCPAGMQPQQPQQLPQQMPQQLPQQMPQQQPQAPVAVPGPIPYQQNVHGFYPYYGLGAEEAGKKKKPWYDFFGLCTKGEE